MPGNVWSNVVMTRRCTRGITMRLRVQRAPVLIAFASFFHRPARKPRMTEFSLREKNTAHWIYNLGEGINAWNFQQQRGGRFHENSIHAKAKFMQIWKWQLPHKRTPFWFGGKPQCFICLWDQTKYAFVYNWPRLTRWTKWRVHSFIWRALPCMPNANEPHVRWILDSLSLSARAM